MNSRSSFKNISSEGPQGKTRLHGIDIDSQLSLVVILIKGELDRELRVWWQT